MALLGLLGQVARFLEESGSTPSHRKGAQTIYGQRLRRVLLAAAASALAPAPVTSDAAQKDPLLSNGAALDLDFDATAWPLEWTDVLGWLQ